MARFFLMALTAAFLTIFSGAARANTVQIPIPALGAILVMDNTDCTVEVRGHVSARKAGDLAAKILDAQSECHESKARISALLSEGAAVESLVEPIMKGGDVSYRRKGDSTSFATGNAARTHTLTEFAQNDPRMGFGGVFPSGRIDPNLIPLARMQGMQMGYTSLFADDVQAMPAAPAAAPAQCGATPAECQEAVDAMRRVLDARKGS